MDLSIIIVNYNVKHFLEQCLYSVRRAVAGINAEIWVVDNASSDGSLPYLQPLFPEVKWMESRENLGFAKANNLALAKATGNYILFLNPDTLLPEDCLQACFSFFAQKPDAGALGIRMVDGSGAFLPESKRAFPSPLTSFYKLVGLSALFPRSSVFARYYLGHLPENQSHPVDVLAGAFIMARRQVLEKTGGFDERFFMYGEDIDLSYRIQQTPMPEEKTHWQNYYFAGTSMVHFKGESTKKGSLNYVMLFYKAMGQFVKKHYASGSAGLFSLLLYLAIAARAFFSLVKRMLQKAGLPLLDLVLISACLYGVWRFWIQWVRPDVLWVPGMVQYALPAFAALLLVSGAFTGLYSKWYAPRRAVGAMLLILVMVLAVYSLLPEAWRFSRGIVLFGGLLSGMAMLGLRQVAVRWGWLRVDNEADWYRQTLVAGTQEDYLEIEKILKHHYLQNRLLGRLSVADDSEENALMPLAVWLQNRDRLPVREVIFCPGVHLPLQEIMPLLKKQKNIRYKFHYAGSNSIVGSDDSNYAGEAVSGQMHYRLGLPGIQNTKRMLDIAASVFFMISWPVHLICHPRPAGLWANSWKVLSGKATWVGYAGTEPELPPLKPCILCSNALPVGMQASLNEETRHALNHRYALGYHYRFDISALWKGYRHTGVSAGNQ